MKIKDILDPITPLRELKETFEGRRKECIAVMIIDFLISSFISGWAYQYIELLRNRIRKIVLFDSFIYGIKRQLILTLLIAAFFFYGYFKIIRSINHNRKDYEDGVVRSKNGTFGRSHFQTPTEKKKNFNIYDKIEDTVEEILFQDDEGKVYCLKYPGGMPHNRLYCGAPGSGKSAATIKTDIYQCIRGGHSILVTDSKGSLYNETAAIAKKSGLTVKVLNLKPEEFRNSNGFNVMANLDPNSESFAGEAQVIANIIVTNTQNGEPLDYWAKTELNALAMGIMHKATDEYSVTHGENNLYGVYKFFSEHADPEELAAIFSKYDLGTPIRNAYNNFAKASKQNQGQTLNGLTNRLWMLNNPTLGEVLSHNEIDLTLPMRKQCIYYVVIDDSDDTYKFIAGLFFTSIFKAQCYYSDHLSPEEKANQLTVYYELDEYKNIGGIIGLDTKASTVRSRKIMLTIILQFLAQLKIVHGEDKAKEIMNDCVVKGLLSTNDPETAQFFSDGLGTFTAVTEGERFEEAATDLLHMHQIKKKNMGEQARPLRYPHSLMNDEFGRDEIIYLISSMPPVCEKICFAEKNGEALHFMEALGRELGVKKTSLYRPRWRKLKEEAEAKKEAERLALQERLETEKRRREEEKAEKERQDKVKEEPAAVVETESETSSEDLPDIPDMPFNPEDMEEEPFDFPFGSDEPSPAAVVPEKTERNNTPVVSSVIKRVDSADVRNESKPSMDEEDSGYPVPDMGGPMPKTPIKKPVQKPKPKREEPKKDEAALQRDRKKAMYEVF